MFKIPSHKNFTVIPCLHRLASHKNSLLSQAVNVKHFMNLAVPLFAVHGACASDAFLEAQLFIRSSFVSFSFSVTHMSAPLKVGHVLTPFVRCAIVWLCIFCALANDDIAVVRIKCFAPPNVGHVLTPFLQCVLMYS